jgi:hypothetical protein
MCNSPEKMSSISTRLTWHKHIFAKWKHLGITPTKMYWLRGRKSKLRKQQTSHIQNNTQTDLDLTDCNSGVPLLFGSLYLIIMPSHSSTSNIEILEGFQSKALCMIVDSTWFMQNTVIRKDFQPPLQFSIQSSPQPTPKRPCSEPHGATREQAIAKTPAK